MAMIVVNNPGSWATIYSPLQHADWHGCTPTDLVFPFFLFIVGVAVALSLGRAAEDKNGHGSVIVKLLKRSTLLFLIGLFLNAFPYFDLYELRIPGVLQRIAIVFFVCAVLFLKFGWRTQAVIGAVILMAYWLLFILAPFPGGEAGALAKGHNIAAWIDYQLLEGHMWSVTGSWDPEGILSTIPAIVTGITGMLAGQWLSADRSREEKVIVLFAGGYLLIVAGLFWDLFFPINKSLWTSSYVVYTAGIAINFLAILYWLLDIKMYRPKIWIPLKAFGINAIFVYVLSMLAANLLVIIPVGKHHSLQSWLFDGLTTIVEDVYLASFIYSLLFTLLMFIPVWVLYKKNIIIKV